MGSKKKRLKAKFAETKAKPVASAEAQSRRAADLHALFPQNSQTITPTPTPTIPTQTIHTTETRKELSIPDPHYEKPQAETRPPLRTVISNQPYSPAKRVDLSVRKTEKETDWWLGPALIFGAIVMLALGWLHIERAGVVSQPIGHNSTTLEAFERETRQKVEYYRSQLGHRLNRDRVNVEILNSNLAPALEASASVPRVDRSMMRGVPLMQESYIEQNYGSHNQVNPMPIDHPDARIQYGLQEEQHRDEFDRRVQHEYVREFVENARRDGVNVVIDGEGNVIAVEQIGSASRSPGSYKPGTSR